MASTPAPVLSGTSAKGQTCFTPRRKVRKGMQIQRRLFSLRPWRPLRLGVDPVFPPRNIPHHQGLSIAFEEEGSPRRTAVSHFAFAMSEEDREDLRWYLEDYLQSVAHGMRPWTLLLTSNLAAQHDN